MISPLLRQAQQVTTAESSRTTVRPPGAGLLTWLTICGSWWLQGFDLTDFYQASLDFSSNVMAVDLPGGL
jgi:hypothetical protein